MDLLQYTTLPADTDNKGAPYIRILELLPANPSISGNDQDNIQCSLHIVSIQDPPPYVALFYVWGDTQTKLPISCNGSTLYITPNLHAALLALRTKAPRFLWIDAICINQDDLEERNSQVSIMRHIYINAKTTVI